MKSTFRMAAAAALMAATAYTPALAQNLLTGPTGYQAGDILAHLSVIGVIPENFDSHLTGIPGAKIHASVGVSPELDASYFLTPNLSLQLIAATTRHTITVNGGGLHGTAGSAWVLPPTLTAQWHFAQVGVVRPYVGVGVTVAFFYGVSPSSQLLGVDDKLGLRTAVGPTLDVGFDVPVSGNWSMNVDVKQMFLPTAARVLHGAVRGSTLLDPTVVGVGVGYKF
jgi:outer membrane protein